MVNVYADFLLAGGALISDTRLVCEWRFALCVSLSHAVRPSILRA